MTFALIQKRFWILYPAWILVCAGLFFALRGAHDPSRPDDRLPGDDAGARALQTLQRMDAHRFASYEVAHVAYSPRGELGDRARWVVLCESESSGLSGGVVVELDAYTGKLLRIRPPAIGGGPVLDTVASDATGAPAAGGSLK